MTKYSVEITGVEGGQKLSAEGAVELTTSLNKDGYLVKSKSLGVILRVGTDEIRDDRPNVNTITYGKRGQVVSAEGADESVLRLARATKFVSPQAKVSEGDTWAVEYQAKGSVSASKMTFTVKGIARVNGSVLVTVAMEFLESPREGSLAGSGLFTIDAKDGALISSNLTLMNWMDGGTKPGTYSAKRI